MNALSDAVVQVGTLELQGPESGQEKKCARGETCSLDEIQGVALQSGDQIKVLTRLQPLSPDQGVGGKGRAGDDIGRADRGFEIGDLWFFTDGC